MSEPPTRPQNASQPTASATVRRNPLTGDVVLFATQRELRPNDFTRSASPSAASASASCPFCPHNEAETPEPRIDYPAGGPWQTRVIPNRYPAVAAADRHLVFIESRRHVACWTELTEEEQAWTLQAYQDQLRRCWQRGHRFAQLFKNSGDAAGASLQHCHSQLIAAEVIPARLLAEWQAAQDLARRGRCHFCELAADPQFHVAGSERLLAVCPPASRFAFEVWIFPRRCWPRLDAMDGPTCRELAALLTQCVGAVRRELDQAAYNWVVLTVPAGCDVAGYHWRVELFPRLARMAGYEFATGQYINSRLPEDAARILRNSVSGGTGRGTGLPRKAIPNRKTS